MPIPKTAVALVLLAASFAFAPRTDAAETDPVSDTAPVASPVRNLFSSWFSTKTVRADEAIAEEDTTIDMPSPISSFATPRAGGLVIGALGLLGISYRMGGSTPSSGFDCSGMVRYVFQTTLGLDLPRRAEEISRVGARVDRTELKPGDLVFYKTLRKTFSHVGIYLGNNRFIHAPSAGGAVRVDDMTQSYWAARFNGARRVGS